MDWWGVTGPLLFPPWPSPSGRVSAAAAQHQAAHSHLHHLPAKAPLWHLSPAALPQAVPQNGHGHQAAQAVVTPRAVQPVVLQVAAPQKAPVQVAHPAAVSVTWSIIRVLLVQVLPLASCP